MDNEDNKDEIKDVNEGNEDNNKEEEQQNDAVNNDETSTPVSSLNTKDNQDKSKY